MPETEPEQQKSEQEASTEQPTEAPQEETDSTTDPGQLRGKGLDKVLDDPSLPDWAQGQKVRDLVDQTQAVMDSFDQTAQQANPSSQQGTAAQQRQQFQQTQQQVQGQQQFAGQQQAPQVQPGASPQQMQQAAQQAQAAGLDVPDPDLAYDDPDQYRAQLNQAIQQAASQVAQQQIQQASVPILQSMSQQAREQSKRDPDLQEVWQKYEPEIRSLVQQRLPLQQQATKQSWDMAAKMVRSNHFDELVQERAQQVAGQQSGQAPATERSAGSPAAGGDRTYRDAIDQLWNESDSEYVEHAKRQDLTPQDLRQRAAQMGISAEQFAEQVEKQNLISTAAGLTETSAGS